MVSLCPLNFLFIFYILIMETNLHGSAPNFNYAEVKIDYIPDWHAKHPIGQIGGLSYLKNAQLIVFHRADRVWKQGTFSMDHKLSCNTTIQNQTVLHIDPVTGKILFQWGSNLFYLPHGAFVDAKTEDIWLTDVGSHTVMRFTKNQWDKPSLLLGTHLVPGNDESHFCQPAAVATNDLGEIFVADGYCNHRVVKFGSDGNYIKSWGSHSGQFDIVHSLTIIDTLQWICVADRERAQVECFDFDGNFKQIINHQEIVNSIYAIQWSKVHQKLFGVTENDNQGFLIVMNETGTRNKATVFSWKQVLYSPHDLTLSADGKQLFVGQLNHKALCKFSVK